MSKNLGAKYWESFGQTYWKLFLEYVPDIKELKSTPKYHPASDISSELIAVTLQDIASLLDIKLGEIDENNEDNFPVKMAQIARELCDNLKKSSLWSDDKTNIHVSQLAKAWMVVWSTFGSFVFNKVPHLPRWLLVYQQLKVITHQ